MTVVVLQTSKRQKNWKIALSSQLIILKEEKIAFWKTDFFFFSQLFCSRAFFLCSVLASRIWLKSYFLSRKMLGGRLILGG
jgi:hypothetical protein